MPLRKLSNEILYVPFTHEYNVSTEIQEKLDERAFFSECFVYTDFEDEIKAIDSLNDDQITDPEYIFTKKDLIHEFEQCIAQRESFIRWFRNHETAVYCITGDAGTGKTTYLHYLKYHYSDYNWVILDIQKAQPSFQCMGHDMPFLNFDLLSQKAISTILLLIRDYLFVRISDTGQYDFDTIKTRINHLNSAYKSEIAPFYPLQKIDDFFSDLNASVVQYDNLDAKSFCEECCQTVVRGFEKLVPRVLNNLDDSKKQQFYISQLKLVINLLLVFLRCIDSNKKYIIAFDNIERFIGTDEIYNNEIVCFISLLRGIHDDFRNQFIVGNQDRFARNFQFLVSMRNTSTRMFTPQQVSDFLSHTMDISDWVSINQIVTKKMQWYSNNAISIDNIENLMMILDDVGCAGETIRGIRLKLDLLFNYNKRLIAEFLAIMLSRKHYEKVLREAVHYNNNTQDIDNSLARFAFRSIIWRIILEELKTDELYKYMCVDPSSDIAFCYGYRILTILNNYALDHNNRYMSFQELLRELYPKSDNPVSSFYDSNNIQERERVSKLLFYMNYYDRRNDNWLQFIDIQYNLESAISVKIPTYEALMMKICDCREGVGTIGIRITNGGKAYLSYIVQSYEFFSSRRFSYNSLVFSLPSLSELNQKSEISDLRYIKQMNEVVNYVVSFVISHRENICNSSIRLRKNNYDNGHTYNERVFNSQFGYLNNVLQCFGQLMLKYSPETSIRYQSKIDAAVSEIKNRYSVLIRKDKE